MRLSLPAASPGSGFRAAAVIAAAALLASLSGCALFADPDPVAGHWSGHWYVGKITKPGGKLECDVERTGKNEWKAVFTAEFGQTASYTVELLGRREGEKAVFGGDVDLGAASGGVFTWTGEAGEGKFTGKYSSKLYGGWFEMTPAPKPAAPGEAAPAGEPAK